MTSAQETMVYLHAKDKLYHFPFHIPVMFLYGCLLMHHKQTTSQFIKNLFLVWHIINRTVVMLHHDIYLQQKADDF